MDVEADEQTNLNFPAFDLRNRTEIDGDKIEWAVLPNVMAESQDLYEAMLVTRGQTVRHASGVVLRPGMMILGELSCYIVFEGGFCSLHRSLVLEAQVLVTALQSNVAHTSYHEGNCVPEGCKVCGVSFVRVLQCHHASA